MKKVIVIGAGFGGISTASYLAKAGYQVTVIEKNDIPGGRAMQIVNKGFKFDMGPSWYLMPEIYDKYFDYFGKKTSDFFKLIKLDSVGRMYFGDKDYVDLDSTLNKNSAIFETIESGAGAKLKKYISQSKWAYDLALSELLYRDYDKFTSLLNIKLVYQIVRHGSFLSLDFAVSRLFKNKKLQKILLFNTLFLGVPPKKTPSIYTLLAYPIFGQGVWYPLGGIYSLVLAMEEIAKNQGVTFKYGVSVKKIKVTKGVATGVVVDEGKFLPADIIVSNADYPFTEKYLLPKQYQSYKDSYWNKKTIAPSAFVIYLGLNKKLKNLKHHTLYLGSDWDKNFKQIFDGKEWPTDPSYYVCVPSNSDETVAPKNHENVFILVPISADLKDDKQIRQQQYDKIIGHLQKLTGEEFTNNIIFKKIVTINDYKSMYNAFEGTAFGLAHTLFQTAYFRPKIQSKKVSNLFYAGQYVHPGVGMPTAVISGQITAEKIIKNDK